MVEAVRPSSLAARRRINFSPIPRGKVKSAFSEMGRELRNDTTSSSRKGNLKEREKILKLHTNSLGLPLYHI